MSKNGTVWRHLAAVAGERFDAGARRKLVPVLGSGFVTQAVLEGVRARGREGARGPKPVDWLELLRGVALEFGLERAAAHVEHDVPGQTTLLWDSMLAELAAGKNGGAPSKAAHRWEAELRRAVAERLADDRATVRLARPFVRSFLKLGWEDVLTFNFDDVMLAGAKRPVVGAGGPGRAAIHAMAGGARIWFPHGQLADPRSIVLGARAYGGRVAAMQVAFDDHARIPSPRPSRQLPTWVATVLERPLLFAGLSLTREEWTIWWLLAQRARFLARRPPAERPAAFVFARRPAPSERLEAHGAYATLSRACELLGLELLGFGDFATGWRRLKEALAWR